MCAWSQVVVGNLIVLNLSFAILLDNFSQDTNILAHGTASGKVLTHARMTVSGKILTHARMTASRKVLIHARLWKIEPHSCADDSFLFLCLIASLCVFFVCVLFLFAVLRFMFFVSPSFFFLLGAGWVFLLGLSCICFLYFLLCFAAVSLIFLFISVLI